MEDQKDAWGKELEYQKNISIITAMIIISSIFYGIVLTHPNKVLLSHLFTLPEMALVAWIITVGTLLLTLVSVRYYYIKKLYQPTHTNKEATE